MIVEVVMVIRKSDSGDGDDESGGMNIDGRA